MESRISAGLSGGKASSSLIVFAESKLGLRGAGRDVRTGSMGVGSFGGAREGGGGGLDED